MDTITIELKIYSFIRSMFMKNKDTKNKKIKKSIESESLSSAIPAETAGKKKNR